MKDFLCYCAGCGRRFMSVVLGDSLCLDCKKERL